MAHAGKEISNPVMAGTVKFIRTAVDTAGELLEMEATCSRADESAPEHYHPYQDEHIEVLSGMVSVQIKGQERTYVAGESFQFPRGVPHIFRGAAGSEKARILWQIRPALDTETFFETVYGLAADGKMKSTRLPNLFQLAVIFRAFNKEIQLMKAQRMAQKFAMAILAFIGRILGYRARYDRYSGPEIRSDAIASILVRR